MREKAKASCAQFLNGSVNPINESERFVHRSGSSSALQTSDFRLAVASRRRFPTLSHASVFSSQRVVEPIRKRSLELACLQPRFPPQRAPIDETRADLEARFCLNSKGPLVEPNTLP